MYVYMYSYNLSAFSYVGLKFFRLSNPISKNNWWDFNLAGLA